MKNARCAFIPSEDGILGIDTENYLITAAAAETEEKTLTVYAEVDIGTKVLRSNQVSITVKPIGDSPWVAMNQTASGWEFGESWEQPDGSLQVSGTGKDLTLVHKAYAMTEGTFEVEIRNASGVIPGLLLNAATTGYNTAEKQQAIRILLRNANTVQIERSGKQEDHTLPRTSQLQWVSGTN